MNKYIIEPSELQQEIIDLSYEFVDFWQNLISDIALCDTENIEEIISTWNNFFPSHSKTTMRLVKTKMAVEQLEGEEPNVGLVVAINELIEKENKND